MANSKFIAGLIGPSLIALSLSEALNLHIWKTNIAPVTYLNGLILFVAGLAIVRAHNHWTLGWPVMVTLTGWVLLLGGLVRMLFPEAQQAPQHIYTYMMLVVLFTVGLILTSNAYKREER